MIRILAFLALAMLATSAATASVHRFDVVGDVRNARFANVSLHSASTPWSATANTDPAGRFKFSKVPEGVYTLMAFGRRGEAHQTVQVTAAAAAANKSKSKVRVHVLLAGDSVRTAMRRNLVSLRQLSIPEKAFKLYGDAEKHLQKDDTPGAVEKLKEAVGIAPGFLAAYSKLSIIAFHQKKFPDAEGYLREGLKQEPTSYDLLSKLVQVLTVLGRHREAVTVGESVLKIRPGDPMSNSQIGVNLLELGEVDGAVQHLTAAKKVDPNHFSAPQLVLARIWMDRRKPDWAIGEVEDYLKRHPGAPDAASLRAWMERIRQSRTISP